MWMRIAIVDRVAHSEAEQLWRVVGYGEGEVSERKLAYNSPVAEDLLGRSVGDVVETTLAGREVEIEVLEVCARPHLDGAPRPRWRGSGGCEGSARVNVHPAG